MGIDNDSLELSKRFKFDYKNCLHRKRRWI